VHVHGKGLVNGVPVQVGFSTLLPESRCDLAENPQVRKPQNGPLLRYRLHMKQLKGSGRLSSLLCIGVFVAFFSAEHAVPIERSFTLPCEATSFVQSGDGAIIWFACEDQSLRKRWETEATEAQKKNLPPPPPPVTSHSPTDVYGLEIASGRVTPLVHAGGRVEMIAAPLGTKMILVLPKERGSGLPVLYDGPRQMAELPIDPTFLAWSADASKIYFYGGSTVQSDAWNILGVLRLNGLAVSREKLVEPTENVYVCSDSGHIFTGDPIPNRQGELEANTVEYDSNIRFLKRITKFLPGHFSVGCRYVATEQSFPRPFALGNHRGCHRQAASPFRVHGRRKGRGIRVRLMESQEGGRFSPRCGPTVGPSEQSATVCGASVQLAQTGRSALFQRYSWTSRVV
jgi:hypothetical protein